MTTKKLLTTALTALFALGPIAGCLGGGGDKTAAPAPEPGMTPGPASGTTPAPGKTRFLQAGSSTVLPIAEVWAEDFGDLTGVEFVVSGGGTGAGFKQFCRGEIDVSDASRPIKSSEADECKTVGVTPFEINVAIDGLAVVVSERNTFVDHLTVAELNRIWTADAGKQANRWRDLRPGWPDEPIVLYGPGTDSGTFDYFVEVIIHPFDGKETKGRSDYNPSEDDNVLVQGVASSPYALGYFGLAYVSENADRIKAVPIDDETGGEGPVAPTADAVESGRYQPLARPIFMYSNGKPTGNLLKYFEFGLSEEGQALVTEVGYVKVPAPARAATLAKIRGG